MFFIWISIVIETSSIVFGSFPLLSPPETWIHPIRHSHIHFCRVQHARQFLSLQACSSWWYRCRQVLSCRQIRQRWVLCFPGAYYWWYLHFLFYLMFLSSSCLPQQERHHWQQHCPVRDLGYCWSGYSLFFSSFLIPE